MVDFNNETTVKTAPAEVVKIIILQKKEYLSDSWEDYDKKAILGDDDPKHLAVISARLKNLFMDRISELKRKMSKEDFLKLKKMVYTFSKENLLEATEILFDYLDAVGLTKIDFMKRYDRTNIEESNIHHGVY